MRTFPYLLTAINYVLIVAAINALSITWSLVAEDYCHPASRVYAGVKTSKDIRNLISEENQRHRTTVKAQSNKKLTDEEILK